MKKKPDAIPWKEKARGLLLFAVQAHNATWKSKDPSLQLGRATGIAMATAFAVECSLKGLLVKEGTPITTKLEKHNLHMLFLKLSTGTQTKASSTYKSIIQMEEDSRIQNTPANSLGSCLQIHDNSFTDWRYYIDQAGVYYPVLMLYACMSLLTILFPKQRFTAGSGSSPAIEIVDGKISGYEV